MGICAAKYLSLSLSRDMFPILNLSIICYRTTNCIRVSVHAFFIDSLSMPCAILHVCVVLGIWTQGMYLCIMTTIASESRCLFCRVRKEIPIDSLYLDLSPYSPPVCV